MDYEKHRILQNYGNQFWENNITDKQILRQCKNCGGSFWQFLIFFKPQTFTQFKIRDSLTKLFDDSRSAKDGFELSIHKLFHLHFIRRIQQKLNRFFIEHLWWLFL